MIFGAVIAKIVKARLTGFREERQAGYPHFLWVTVWITMFTTLRGGVNSGFEQGAL